MKNINLEEIKDPVISMDELLQIYENLWKTTKGASEEVKKRLEEFEKQWKLKSIWWININCSNEIVLISLKPSNELTPFEKAIMELWQTPVWKKVECIISPPQNSHISENVIISDLWTALDLKDLRNDLTLEDYLKEFWTEKK